MANSIKLFPTYEDYDFDNTIDLSKPYDFYYTVADEDRQLTVSPGFGLLQDPKSQWDIEKNPICFSRSIQVIKPLVLYQKLVPQHSKLALALAWYSPTSNQRGVFEIGDIPNSEDTIELNIEGQFKESTLRGRIQMTTILYIKESAPTLEVLPEEKKFANTEGYLLGELDSLTIIIDGNGSFFPIQSAPLGNKPLWDVVCSWVDPTQDDFCDTVAIVINSDHPDSIFLNKKDKTNFNPLLLREVIASALGVIVETLRSQDQLPDPNDTELAEGSVAQVINYFQNKLNWDLSSPKEFSNSLRLFLERNKKKL